MKKLIGISIVSFIVSVTVFFSCTKKDVAPTHPTIITGKWNWVATYAVYPLGPMNPLTPANTGNTELFVYNADGTWSRTLNAVIIDSGTYSLGHGSYTPYQGAAIFIYDSIQYYKNGIAISGGVDSYVIENDTFKINPGYSDRYTCYSIPYSGSKQFVNK